jgi:LysM repeat protein
MRLMAWWSRAVLAVLLLVSLQGCLPSSQSELEEEKEPHFLAGRNSINSMDYHGAIEEFEKALEVNPHNGKAHFQLGWLYEEKEPDPAAAIYHYEQFLKQRPDSENAEVIRQRITNCKQDLAKTVLTLPISPGLQRQIDQVLDENKRLKEENERWRAYVAGHSPAPSNAVISTIAQTKTPVTPLPPSRESAVSNVSGGGTTDRQSAPTSRTHKVQAGETPAAIARKYGIKLDALLSANPGLEPRRMRVGQILNIPPG